MGDFFVLDLFRHAYVLFMYAALPKRSAASKLPHSAHSQETGMDHFTSFLVSGEVFRNHTILRTLEGWRRSR